VAAAPRRRRAATRDWPSRIVDARHALGLTQQEVADLAGVSRRSVAAVELGKSTVRLDVLVVILDALGLALVLAPPAAVPAVPEATRVTALSIPGSDPTQEAASG
jgi:y4mF family transcriptional regulator